MKGFVITNYTEFRRITTCNTGKLSLANNGTFSYSKFPSNIGLKAAQLKIVCRKNENEISKFIRRLTKAPCVANQQAHVSVILGIDIPHHYNS